MINAITIRKSTVSTTVMTATSLGFKAAVAGGLTTGGLGLGRGVGRAVILVAVSRTAGVSMADGTGLAREVGGTIVAGVGVTAHSTDGGISLIITSTAYGLESSTIIGGSLKQYKSFSRKWDPFV